MGSEASEEVQKQLDEMKASLEQVQAQNAGLQEQLAGSEKRFANAQVAFATELREAMTPPAALPPDDSPDLSDVSDEGRMIIDLLGRSIEKSVGDLRNTMQETARETASGLKTEISAEQAADRLKSDHPELFPLVGRMASDLLKSNPGMTVEAGWAEAMKAAEPVIRPFLDKKEADRLEKVAASAPKYPGGPLGADPFEELSAEETVKKMLADSGIDKTQ